MTRKNTSGHFVADLHLSWSDPHAGVSTCLIRLAGELDLYGSQRLLSAVDDCLRLQTRSILLDLSRLEFLDSEGIRALLQARKRALRSGCQISLIYPANRPVRRLLIRVALDRLFPIIDGELGLEEIGGESPPTALAHGVREEG